MAITAREAVALCSLYFLPDAINGDGLCDGDGLCSPLCGGPPPSMGGSGNTQGTGQVMGG